MYFCWTQARVYGNLFNPLGEHCTVKSHHVYICLLTCFKFNTSRTGQAFIEQTLRNLTHNETGFVGAEVVKRQPQTSISLPNLLPTTLPTPTISLPLPLPTTLPTNNPVASLFPDITTILADNPLLQQLLNPSSPLSTFLTTITGLNLTQAINDTANAGLDAFAGSIASVLGISDFYSMHLLKYCEGKYVPGAIPNATLKKSDIHRDVANCSDQFGLANFSPNGAIASSLNQSGTGISLSNLNLTSSGSSGSGSNFSSSIGQLNKAVKTALAFYIMAVLFNFLAIVAAVWWLSDVHDTRLRKPLVTTICCQAANGMVSTGSFDVTVLAVLSDKYINRAASSLNLSVDRGNGFLGLTWSAFICSAIALMPPMMVSLVILNRKRKERKRRKAGTVEKIRGPNGPSPTSEIPPHRASP